MVHAFADVTLLYLHCRRGDTSSAATQLEWCIADVGLGCQETASTSTRTKPSYCGSDRDTKNLSKNQHDLCLPELHLGHDSVVARDHVRLLGATISSDLSLDRHVSIVSASGFYELRQLRRCRRSIDTQSAATFIHVVECAESDD